MTFKEMMAALTRSFRMVATFSGRDSRSQFWPLPIFLYIAAMFLPQLFIAPIMVDSTRQNIMPVMHSIMMVTSITMMIMIVLLAAAVTRRLHDTGRRGWWGLMPLPFLAFSMVAFPKLSEPLENETEVPADFFGSFGLMFASNLIYIVLLIVLITLLCLKSSPGDNRFGPPPSDKMS